MQVRAELIEQLDRARAKMYALLGEMTVEKELYPGWTIKHVLAHITGWDDATSAALRAHAGGDEPGTPASRGIDFYNAQSVATREGLSYARVLQEWELAREQLKKVLETLPPAKFEEPLLFPWGATGSVAQIIEIMAHHEVEHVDEIRGLL